MPALAAEPTDYAASPETNADEWIRSGEACAMLACSRARLRRLAAAGLITCLEVPQSLPRYSAGSIRDLLAKSIRPARPWPVRATV